MASWPLPGRGNSATSRRRSTLTTRLQNFINGELVDAKSGRSSDVIDPSTGEAYLQAPVSGPRTSTRPCRGGRRVRGVARRPRRPSAAGPAARSPTPSRRGPTSSSQAECRNTGKPLAAHPARRRSARWSTSSGSSPARARMLEGRSAGEYLRRPHLDDPARADRRVRAGHAVELPDGDGGLEDRPGAGGRQHGGAQAVRHHPGHHADAGRDRRASSCRRACSTWSAATATPAARWWRHPIAADGRRSPARSGRAWRSPSRRPTTSSGSTWSSAARRRSSSSTTSDIERGRRGHRRRRATSTPGQDCTAACRVLVARAARTTTSSPRSPRRPRPPGPAASTTRTPSTARSTTPTSWPGCRASSTGRPATPRSSPAASASATGATSSRRPSSTASRQDDEMVQNEIFGPVITVQTLRRRGRGASR